MQGEAGAPKKANDARQTARGVVFTLAVVLLVWFVIGNAGQVQVHFWVTSERTSLIAVILVSAALGAVISLLVSRRRR